MWNIFSPPVSCGEGEEKELGEPSLTLFVGADFPGSQYSHESAMSILMNGQQSASV